MKNLALLILKDGTKFTGCSIGASGIIFGELVFNTSITGYQEIITDPSYYGQIVIFTYPHIGNTGTNKIDNESNKIQVKGIIIRNLSLISSNFRNSLSLSDYLKKQNIIGISNIDTRKLTHLLREKGSQLGYIVSGDILKNKGIEYKISNFKNLNNIDLVKKVSTSKQYIWNDCSHILNTNTKLKKKELYYKIIVYDYGVKQNILRMLVDRGCELIVVPAETPAEDILKIKPDGVFLSNGPGDPVICDYAIKNIKILLNTKIPIFGICLGYQLLALAGGAKTVKMKLGHHGANHPVKDHITGKVIITSQNHGFVVDMKTLPNIFKITHTSLFDGTLQGLHYFNKPIFGFQGHPEGSPGPHDASLFFNYFIKLIKIYHLKFNVSEV